MFAYLTVLTLHCTLQYLSKNLEAAQAAATPWLRITWLNKGVFIPVFIYKILCKDYLVNLHSIPVRHVWIILFHW